MDKNAIWKWVLLIALVAWSLVLVTPLNEKVKLGLDLQGGTSFVLEIDETELADDSVKDARARALEIIRNRVDSMGVSEPIPDWKRMPAIVRQQIFSGRLFLNSAWCMLVMTNW